MHVVCGVDELFKDPVPLCVIETPETDAACAADVRRQLATLNLSRSASKAADAFGYSAHLFR
jgi:hypothetical protein